MNQKTPNFNANLMQLVPDRYDYLVTRNCDFSGQNGQSCLEICKCNNFHLIFFQKKLLDLYEMSQTVFSLFEYLDSVNCNHR